MATRDRFSGFGEPPTTPLQRYICTYPNNLQKLCEIPRKLTYRLVNACDPQNFEPNLALNLEISDLINAKKGNA
jgi:hypothetical protein